MSTLFKAEYKYEYISMSTSTGTSCMIFKHCELIYIIQEELSMQWQLITLFYEEN